MAYIEKADFDGFTTTSIPEPEFNVLAERASDVIDLITMHRITTGGGILELTDANQALVKKAVCAEVETLYSQGGVAALNGNSESTAGNVSLGKFSISRGASGLQHVNGIPISPFVRSYLLYTGLLYRGMNDYDTSPV